jgi:hypothetical protein
VANHPINLALRFVLEISALFSLGYWGWTQHNGLERWFWAVGLPLVAALFWGTLRVPNDPGKAPVAVLGIVRLSLEMLVFSGAVWALYMAGMQTGAIIFLVIVLIHYAISYDRIIWLINQ